VSSLNQPPSQLAETDRAVLFGAHNGLGRGGGLVGPVQLGARLLREVSVDLRTRIGRQGKVHSRWRISAGNLSKCAQIDFPGWVVGMGEGRGGGKAIGEAISISQRLINFMVALDGFQMTHN